MARKRQRQDLNSLKSRAEKTKRAKLDSLVPIRTPDEAHAVVENLRALRKTLLEGPLKMHDLVDVDELGVSDICEKLPPIPVSGLINDEDVPVHVPGVNQKAGHSFVRRRFGGLPQPPIYLEELARFEDLNIYTAGPVYTAGTSEGFSKRLRKQLGMKTVSCLKTYGELRGGKISESQMLKELKKLLPTDDLTGDFPGLSITIEEMLDSLEVNPRSEAGFPYVRSKLQAASDIVNVVLPVVVEAIKTGKIPQLSRSDPELFLSTLKNKLDRYDVEKLGEKTRPYFSIPSHFAMLFSYLCQNFCTTLQTADKNPESMNFYGFSAAHGGYNRLVQWARTCPPRATRAGCYGDDTKIIHKTDDGRILVIDPDFTQMDGCVDKDTIRITINMVLEKLKGGDRTPFWDAVGELWFDFATQPTFLCAGDTPLRKKSPDGLATGVVGTTLFDTAKAVLSYNALFEHMDKTLPRTQHEKFLRSDAPIVYLREKCGLIVKEGTWVVTTLGSSTDGNTVFATPFLGQMVRAVQDIDGAIVHVPHLEYETWLQSLTAPRETMDLSGPAPSAVSKRRTAMDRYRGLYLTGGAFDERFALLLGTLFNELPADVILMDPQNTKEPISKLLPPPEWKSTSGFPTARFVLNLYRDAPLEGPDWFEPFPEFEYKHQAHVFTQKFQLDKKQETNTWPVVQVEASSLELGPRTGALLDMPKYQHPDVKVEHNPRSTIRTLQPNSALVKSTEKKRLPTRAESLAALVKNEGDIVSFSVLEPYLRPSVESRAKDLADAGLFATGLNPDDIVSRLPILTPTKTFQEIIHTYMQESSTMAAKNALQQVPVKQNDGTYQATGPLAAPISKVVLDVPWVRKLVDATPSSKVARDPLAILNFIASKSGYGITFKTLAQSPVTVALMIGKLQPQKAPVFSHKAASCSGPNTNLCKDAIAFAIFQEMQNGQKAPLSCLAFMNSSTPFTYQKPEQKTTWSSEVYGKDMEAPVSNEKDLQKPTSFFLTEKFKNFVTHGEKFNRFQTKPDNFVSLLNLLLAQRETVLSFVNVSKDQNPVLHIMVRSAKAPVESSTNEGTIKGSSLKSCKTYAAMAIVDHIVAAGLYGDSLPNRPTFVVQTAGPSLDKALTELPVGSELTLTPKQKGEKRVMAKAVRSSASDVHLVSKQMSREKSILLPPRGPEYVHELVKEVNKSPAEGEAPPPLEYRALYCEEQPHMHEQVDEQAAPQKAQLCQMIKKEHSEDIPLRSLLENVTHHVAQQGSPTPEVTPKIWRPFEVEEDMKKTPQTPSYNLKDLLVEVDTLEVNTTPENPSPASIYMQAQEQPAPEVCLTEKDPPDVVIQIFDDNEPGATAPAADTQEVELYDIYFRGLTRKQLVDNITRAHKAGATVSQLLTLLHNQQLLNKYIDKDKNGTQNEAKQSKHQIANRQPQQERKPRQKQAAKPATEAKAKGTDPNGPQPSRSSPTRNEGRGTRGEQSRPKDIFSNATTWEHHERGGVGCENAPPKRRGGKRGSKNSRRSRV